MTQRWKELVLADVLDVDRGGIGRQTCAEVEVDMDREQRFNAAFPWWTGGKSRHGWACTVEIQRGAKDVRRGGILIALEHDPEKDRGFIKLDMPHATQDQYNAVLAWLEAEYGQAKSLPSTEKDQS